MKFKSFNNNKFPPKHKYNAKKVEINGITFDSTLEGNIYKVFDEKGLNPELQKKIEIQPAFYDGDKKIQPINYKADFVINYNNTDYIIDAKGMLLPEAKLKYKLLLKLGYRVLYLSSMKQASYFCELLFEGKSPKEIETIFVEQKKARKKARAQYL